MLTALLLASVLALGAGPSARWATLHPQADTVETWSVSGGVQRPGAAFVRRLWREGQPRDARWCVEVTWRDSSGVVQAVQHTEADGRTLAPLRYRTHSSTDSCDVRIEHDLLSGYVAPARQARRELHERVSRAALPHELTPDALAAQSLSAGWRAMLTDLEPYRTDSVSFTREARVTGREPIEAAGAARDCWRVEFAEPHGMTRTLWIDVTSRRVWQERGRPASGAFEWYHRVRNP